MCRLGEKRSEAAATHISSGKPIAGRAVEPGEPRHRWSDASFSQISN